MKSVVFRVAWAVVAALLAVNMGVLLTWRSTHAPAPTNGALTAAPSVTAPAEAGGDIAAPSPAPGDVAPAAPAAASRGTKPTTESTPAASAGGTEAAKIDRGDLLFDLTVDPACTTRLKTISATAKAVPGTYVSMVVAYADGQSYGTMYAGPMLPDGTFVLRWTVPAQAAAGTGHVLAAAHDPAQKTSGRNVADFVVKDGAGC